MGDLEDELEARRNRLETLARNGVQVSEMSNEDFVGAMDEFRADVELLHELEAYGPGNPEMAMLHVGPFRRFRDEDELKRWATNLRAVLDEQSEADRRRVDELERIAGARPWESR